MSGLRTPYLFELCPAVQLEQVLLERSFILDYLKKSLKVMEGLDLDEVMELVQILAQARKAGNRIFLCGNGGSASTASHFANDLGKGASLGRPLRFRVTALTDNLPWITALANDEGYSEIFIEQLKNFARHGDALIAISGSGNSSNVIKAVSWANERGLVTIGLTGLPGGELRETAQHVILAQSHHMGRIEECHFLIQHLVAYYFMEMEPAAATES